MYFPEDDPEIFDLMIDYIYRNKLPSFQTSQPSIKQDKKGAVKKSNEDKRGQKELEEEEEDEHYERLLRLFCFAEKFCLNHLANRTMDALQDFNVKLNTIPNAESIQIIYEGTHEKSKLRYFAAIFAGWHSSRWASIHEDADERMLELGRIQPDFALDYLRFNLKFGPKLAAVGFDPRRRSLKWGLEPCFFHTHAEGETCHLI